MVIQETQETEQPEIFANELGIFDACPLVDESDDYDDDIEVFGNTHLHVEPDFSSLNSYLFAY